MQRVEAMDFLVLNLGHAQTMHKWGNRDISSPFVRIYYVKRGTALLHLPDGDLQITPGHMYMVPSYVPHSYECEPEFEFYYLFVYQRMADKIDVFEAFDFPIEVRTNEATQLLFENYCNLYPQLSFPSRDAREFDTHPSYREYAMAYMKMPDYERLQLHGLVEILFSYFMKHAEPRAAIRDERIRRILDYIQQHLAETVTIDQLADAACLTPSYLIRLFRQTTGVTPLQYVSRKKVQHAQALLLGSEMSVQEVSAAVGIADASYFIRMFRKHIGFTPQEYREKFIG